MIRLLALAAAIAALSLTACASSPHTDANMAQGSHVMTGSGKSSVMSDRWMPSRSSDCSESALAKMPSDHREACEASFPAPKR